eukprot:8162562-Lingulodinium_polyedra.AAC.1
MSSASWLDRCWHSRLLSIIYLGVRLGVYKTQWDCPFWTSGLPATETKAPVDSSDSEHEATSKAPAVVASAAASSSSSAAPAKPAPPPAENAPEGVKDGNKEIKAFRKQCKNTLFVASAVLSKPGLQSL